MCEARQWRRLKVCAKRNPARVEKAYVLPLWIVFLLTGVLKSRLPKSFPPGCCPQSGYDLTGNVIAVCPECVTSAGRPSQTEHQ